MTSTISALPPVDASITVYTKSPATGVPQPPPPGRTEPDGGRSMKMEGERLKTFAGWPSPYVTPTSLARAGFYYVRQEDLVRCAFCGIEIGKWEEGDDAMADHRKWSPDCDFVRRLDCGNVPIGGEPSDGRFIFCVLRTISTIPNGANIKFWCVGDVSAVTGDIFRALLAMYYSNTYCIKL